MTFHIGLNSGNRSSSKGRIATSGARTRHAMRFHSTLQLLQPLHTLCSPRNDDRQLRDPPPLKSHALSLVPFSLYDLPTGLA